MSFAARFEELEIWQGARAQVQQTYRRFGSCKDYAFRDQIQRAALSVMNNIAEGFERDTAKDFAHFLDLAKGSCGEVRSMLWVAEDLGYLNSAEAAAARASARELSCKIASFTKHLRPRS